MELSVPPVGRLFDALHTFSTRSSAEGFDNPAAGAKNKKAKAAS